MKRYQVFLFALIGMSLMLASCQNRPVQESPGGISAAETGGFDRQKVYDMQDRTFRQLAYPQQPF